MSRSPPKFDPLAASQQGETPHGSTPSSDSFRPESAITHGRDEYARHGHYGRVSQSPALPNVRGPDRSTPSTASQTPSRAIGVQSILNPANPQDPSPTSYGPFSPALSRHEYEGRGPRVASPRSWKRTEPASPAATHSSGNVSPGRMGRRILTPKSPGLRAASLGARRHPYDVNDDYQPYPVTGREDRVYMVEPGQRPGSDIPPLPRPTLAKAMGSAHASVTSAPLREPLTSFPRHTNSMPPQPPLPGPPRVGRPDSPPLTSSSYAKAERASPILRYRTSPIDVRSRARHNQLPPPRRQRAASGGPSSGYVHSAAAHSLQENYQQGSASFLSLNTDQGPMIVPVELDLQQASKVADEKRKRNAGASARFRARRKEKEKEALTLIQELQQDLNDAREDRDFYLNERNYFRDLARRNLGSNQIPLRPTSPPQRIRRERIAPSESADDVGSDSESAVQVQHGRAGEWQAPFSTPQQAPSSMASPYMHPFSHGPSALPFPNAPGQSLYQDSGRTLHNPAPSHLPPGSRPAPYDPFRPNAYDSSWKPVTST